MHLKSGGEDARHGIEFRHVGYKVHVVCLDGVYAHDALGGEVEDREEHDREVVGHQGHSGPVTLEEYIPRAELEVSRMTHECRRSREKQRGHARRG